MFEDATFESTGAIHTRSRSWMLATLTLNSGILLTLILLPLLYPNSLSPRTFVDPIFTPPRAPAAIAHQAVRALTQSSTSIATIALPTTIPSQLPRLGGIHTTAPAACIDCSDDPIGTGSGIIPGGDPLATTLPSTPAPHVITKPKGPISISKGVAAGMLVFNPSPIYPAIARTARIEGTVILQATISKTGTIEGLHVLSGPPMLQQAAIDAVKQWRYRPYLLNGDPVEVETTINVIFSLGR
jgi:protein TonB